MSSRDAILASVRANLPKADAADSGDFAVRAEVRRPRSSRIQENSDADGRANSSTPARRSRCPAPGTNRPTPPSSVRPRPRSRVTRPSTLSEPRDLADVDIGVVRAAFGVAETGSVWLSEEDLKVNALAYLAQHLVVLLDPSDIVANLHNAYAPPEDGERSHGAPSGPSATADIEGVLILGAQGVRSLSVVLSPGPVEPPEVDLRSEPAHDPGNGRTKPRSGGPSRSAPGRERIFL